MRTGEAEVRSNAKRLRRTMTRAEAILWSRLRGRAIVGLRFRRQHPIGPYIADFADPSARLVVEVDGATHSTDAEIANDKRRDNYLRANGWDIVRIQNNDIYRDSDAVIETISRRSPHPGLRPDLPSKRGRWKTKTENQ